MKIVFWLYLGGVFALLAEWILTICYEQLLQNRKSKLHTSIIAGVLAAVFWPIVGPFLRWPSQFHAVRDRRVAWPGHRHPYPSRGL